MNKDVGMGYLLGVGSGRTAVTYFAYGILSLWDIQLTFERWRFRLRSAHH